MKSWDKIDAARHWMYEDIYDTLKNNLTSDFGIGTNYCVEIGSREPTTPVILMMEQLAEERQQTWGFVARPYPEVDIHKLCYLPDELDMVIADQVMEHVAMPWVGANEMHRVLRKGGIAVCSTPFFIPIHPNPDDYWRFTKSAYKILFPDKLWTTLTLQQWGTKEVVQWAFNDPSVRGFSGDWITIDRAVKEVPNFETQFDDGNFPVMVWWVGKKK